MPWAVETFRFWMMLALPTLLAALIVTAGPVLLILTLPAGETDWMVMSPSVQVSIGAVKAELTVVGPFGLAPEQVAANAGPAARLATAAESIRRCLLKIRTSLSVSAATASRDGAPPSRL